MTQSIVLSGTGRHAHRAMIDLTIRRNRPRAIGLVSAFVTVGGMKELLRIARGVGTPACRLVAGIDHAITHPRALSLALDSGWQVRLGRAVDGRGIFHPKLLVAGSGFSRTGEVRGISCMYVGSSNLTTGGLERNVECGLVAEREGCINTASSVFAEIWALAQPATPRELRNYAARFADCARRRSPLELNALGVSDVNHIPTGPADLTHQTPPNDPAMDSGFAVAAWAGLQSFTGEYRFQVEFPRSAGEVVSELVRGRAWQNDSVDVYCPDDGTTRPMQYRFYADNSMFRLNIPNDVPGIAWARENRDGMAIVESGPAGGAPLRLRILRPGREADEVAARSVALGTWGRTPTRAYGWF